MASPGTRSTGLPDPEHYTTARDIATLSVALIREFPDIYAWFSTPQFTWNGITQRNRNRLLTRDPTVDGIKTGFTDAAGYCLAASALRDGRRLVAAVLGTASDKARTEAASALLNWGFRFSETHRVYAAGQPVTQVRVWKGEVEGLDLGLTGDLYVTVPQGRYEALDAKLDIEPRVLAPVAAGQSLGTLSVRLDDAELARRPLVATQAVPEGSFFSRIVDDVRLLFE